MAHALRYYKELTQPDGTVIRLEIHKKKLGDAIAVASEIGRVVQALHLDIQGGADTIDAPIVKTSLTMTFVDAPDLEKGRKCGNWEEFYTPDSTMWKVVLKADGKTIWGGYVTPDSYQEDLRYRGSVTIIARDNIGHMQDFPFDMEGNAEGMVTLQELVNEAWAKIESPMSLDWRHEADNAMYLLCDGVEAPQTYMNVSAFEDMNYFDAVEKALYSYGLVMRYTGSNRVTIMSLRDLPYQGKSSAPRAIEPTFLAHAQRELAPAVRRIEESVKYEFTDGIQIPLAKNVTFSGVAYTVPFYSTNVFGETTTKSIPVHAIANTDGEGWSNVPSSTLFFNPKNYTLRQTALAEDAERMLFLACNTDGSHSAIYRKTVVCADFRINMTFGRPIERDSYGGVGYCYGFSDSEDREQNGIGSLSAKSVDCYISREQNGIQQFFDGHTWSADAVLLTIEVTDRQCGIDVPLGDSSGTAEVTLTIVDVRLNDKWDFSDGLGLYIPISSMYWGVAETASLCETNNINTVYIDTNNVILEHSPELAPALDEVPFPSVIKNGIFVKSGNAYFPAKGWAWSGGTPQQMAVYNHLQLLCYHSKPNNVISGDIVNADFVDMEAIYEWGGANHLLVSGSYNFLNGRIESAVLREFKFYNEMWSDVAGAEVPETEQNNRTTAESGSGASKVSTYSNATTVNIGGTGGGGTSDIVIDDTLSIYSTNAIQNKAVATALNEKADAAELANKQDKLVSGTNIKTVNGESILGEGNIVIQGGEGGAITVDAALSITSTNPVQNKVVANSINGINDSLDGINNVLNAKVTYVPEVTGMLSNAYLNPGGAITANQYGWAVRYRYIAQDCDVSYKAGKVGNIGAFISDTIPEIGKTYSLIGWGATTLLEGVIKVTGGKYFCSTYNVDSQANDVYVTATYRETTNIPERLNGIENDSAEYRKSTLASSYFLGNRMVDTMTRTRWHHSTDTKIGNFTPVSATADTITLSATDAACITRIVILACELQDKSCEFIYFTASSNNTITKLYDFGEDIDCRNIVKMQCLHDTTEGSYGIHLSPLGYRAMAKDILRQTQKVQQFSDIRFCGGWTAQFCKGAVNYTDTKVVDSYDNIVCEPLLDGVLTGGSNLCWMVYARAIGSTINARTCYEITQSSPNGATITFPIKAYYGFKGFVRVVCGRETDSTGLVVMSIKSNGELIKSIDIPNALDSFVIELNDKLYNSIDVEFSMPSASLTKLKILEITLHETYVMPSQYRPIDSSSVVAFFGSSNTQFPSLQVADNLCPNDDANATVVRPDGTSGDGCGYLPKELARLSGAVVDNWGKSGEKTQYGLDKIAEVFSRKRYTHIILSFFGNDLNAGIAPSTVISNIRRMCEYAKGCGCIPVVLLGYGSESPNEANNYALMYDSLTQGFDSPFVYTNSALH